MTKRHSILLVVIAQKHYIYTHATYVYLLITGEHYVGGNTQIACVD